MGYTLPFLFFALARWSTPTANHGSDANKQRRRIAQDRRRSGPKGTVKAVMYKRAGRGAEQVGAPLTTSRPSFFLNDSWHCSILCARKLAPQARTPRATARGACGKHAHVNVQVVRDFRTLRRSRSDCDFTGMLEPHPMVMNDLLSSQRPCQRIPARSASLPGNARLTTRIVTCQRADPTPGRPGQLRRCGSPRASREIGELRRTQLQN